MGRDIFDPALETLDDLYSISDVPFTVSTVNLAQKVHWVPRWEVLDTSNLTVIRKKVTHVVKQAQGAVILCSDEIAELFDLVVIAAGFWSNEIFGVHVHGLIGRQGVAYLGEGQVDNIIKPWAPNKQMVSFNETDTSFWIGDGTAINPENWTDAREKESQQRAEKLAQGQSIRPVRGIRPYSKYGKPCVLEETNPGLWVATGGAKNGLIAAGWSAYEICRRTN